MSDTPLSESQLLSLLELTNTMQNAVACQKWEEINKLDVQRLSILNTNEPVKNIGSAIEANKLSIERTKLEETLAEADKQLQNSLNELHRRLIANGQNFHAHQYAQQKYKSTHSLDQGN